MSGLEQIRSWFASRGWTPKAFQEACWAAQRAGESGLVQVATGEGKTYAAYGGALSDWIEAPYRGLSILYLTPLRAMTRDLEKALKRPVEELSLDMRVESRTGDTSTSLRAKQKEQMPEVLLTTPESLSLLMSYEGFAEQCSGLRLVIVDEWHELLASKRGVQVELGLARLRQWCPALRTWALSATVAEPERVAQAAVGWNRPYTLVQGRERRRLKFRTLLPESIEKLPWAGNLGLSMVSALVRELTIEESSIVFANTRAQAELWFEAILRERPEWHSLMAVHHGSLDRDEREQVEHGLKEGKIRLVVSTSSLDLGVDFSPVEHVYQIGSPKGVARILQRGGRAKHRPGVEESEMVFVPTHTLQLVEFAATRGAVERHELEPIAEHLAPVDLLIQHLVTVGLGGGFEPADLLAEIRTTYSYRDLDEQTFNWAMEHLLTGGKTLEAYPEHHRLVRGDGGGVAGERKFARRHRATIGTIASDGMVTVRYLNGRRIGSVEENFVAKLRPGEVFLFAGKTLEYVRLNAMEVYVRPGRKKRSQVPHYAGGRMPLSNQLAKAVRRELDAISRGSIQHPEVAEMKSVLEVQAAMSAIPRMDECLVELCQSKAGWHCFIFPLEGRRVHDGLASLFAYRLAKLQPATFAVARNDYGLELLSPSPFPYAEAIPERGACPLFSTESLLQDTMESINLSELARRQFRGIARVAGLVFDGYPSARKSPRQLQSSSGLIYDVFMRFDPDNLLLQQAQEEVLREQFEQERLATTLERLQKSHRVVREVDRPTPFSMPLVADRNQVELSSETKIQRLQRMKERWKRA